jgi:hypothetical protein
VPALHSLWKLLHLSRGDCSAVILYSHDLPTASYVVHDTPVCSALLLGWQLARSQSLPSSHMTLQHKAPN